MAELRLNILKFFLWKWAWKLEVKMCMPVCDACITHERANCCCHLPKANTVTEPMLCGLMECIKIYNLHDFVKKNRARSRRKYII